LKNKIIGIHNSTISDYSGGGLYYLNSLIYGLNKYTNFEIVVYYSDKNYEKYIFKSERIKWVKIKRHNSFIHRILNIIQVILKKKIVKYEWNEKQYGKKPDLIISQESLFGFYMEVKFIGFIGDIMYKYYPSLEEYSYKKRFVRNLSTETIIKKSLKVAVDSELASNDISKHFKCKKSKLKIIPLCAPPHFQDLKVDINQINKDSFLEKYSLFKKYLFYPAQFWEHKNHINLLLSMKKVIEKGFQISLVLVGSKNWPFYEKIDEKIKSLFLSEYVKTFGYVDDNEIINFYQYSRALIYPSFADYTGIPIVEAMMLGKPIIASNTFAIPEQVGDCGIFFDPNNINMMADKIIELISDDELHKKLSINSFNRSKIFSMKKFSNQWEYIINESCDK